MSEVRLFNNILKDFNIQADCIDYKKIESYFYFDVKLRPLSKIKDIQKYSEELALSINAPSKPSIKILHQEGVIRLEFAVPCKEKLCLFDLFSNNDVPEGELVCLLGQSVNGKKIWMDLAKNPHMIISGTTGSGKSTLLHNIIANLFNYSNVNLFLMDPKNIEFIEYDKKIDDNINISYDYNEAIFTIDTLLDLMECRYDKIKSGYNASNFPYVVLIIDEFADLIIQDENKDFYNKLSKLAQKCRAARIHIILSTQRPSVNIINGMIKANFPARISCKVASHIDSKIILDAVGAEDLIGNGDALIKDNYRNMERFQIAYTDANEVCSYFGK